MQRQKYKYRFDARTGAITEAVQAANTACGCASAVIATTELGARRILAKKLSKAALAGLYVCHREKI